MNKNSNTRSSTSTSFFPGVTRERKKEGLVPRTPQKQDSLDHCCVNQYLAAIALNNYHQTDSEATPTLHDNSPLSHCSERGTMKDALAREAESAADGPGDLTSSEDLSGEFCLSILFEYVEGSFSSGHLDTEFKRNCILLSVELSLASVLRAEKPPLFLIEGMRSVFLIEGMRSRYLLSRDEVRLHVFVPLGCIVKLAKNSL
mmetsp:Transcript_89780/g.140502  ORF Transcript_89780/g.140502 Transcript_89780/m.140502 type:complete len:202 (+) Transcript_89780:3-608(+)